MKLSRFFKDNWVITLFSTMFGVIAGLYLTDYYEDRRLNKSKLNALEMVKQEIKNNKEELIAYDSICRSMYHRSSYVLSKINAENQIFIHKDSIEIFRRNANGIIENLEFETNVSHKNTVQVRGDMTMLVRSKLALVDLNDVIWQSYKQTNYINVTSFNCITSLEELYQFQAKNNLANKEWLDLLLKGSFLQGKDQLDEFILAWNNAIEMNTILLGTYDSLDDIFKNCN
ncbi:hypothetical protein [Winogradskyella sp.]|uniref:hypothetical protein n=1 Tax=Winogradskyella sp. TaxID=1883156 RepID=UPI0026349CAE|nr:hypothetical protein [Winogradskyella sp.]